MSWGNPWMLLAVLVPLFAALALRRLSRKGSSHFWPAMKRVAVSGEHVRVTSAPKVRPAYLVLVAIALAILAIAQPRWGEHTEETFSDTREILIALDLSRSMLTEDLDGTARLDRAKQVTEDLLNSLKGESVGLVVFAGTSFVQVPLSPDYQIIREFLPNLNPEYLPKGGSNYTRMLATALEGFSEADDRDRYLIVLSDGESSTQGWPERVAELVKRQIHVVSIGVGTEKGAFIPDGQGGYYSDKNGDPVLSRLGPATLQTLATRTNGKYVNVASLQKIEDVSALLKETVAMGRKGRVSNAAGTVHAERYQWLLFPALLLAMAGLWLEFQQMPKPRQVRRAAGAPEKESLPTVRQPAAFSPPRARNDRLSKVAAFAAAALLALAAAPRVQAHFDSDAQFEVKEVFDSNPIERVRAIAAHLAKFDYDAYDLRLMVEETIKYGIDEQRQGNPPIEGVIRDAIEASRRGEQLDPKIANWPYYRSQLTTLLAKLDNDGDRAHSSASEKDALDEEDTGPMVVGENSQQSGTDSYGQGASSKTDAALGDLTADETLPPPHRRPTPPRKVKTATMKDSEGDSGNAQDPILAFSRRNLQEVAKRDQPGRLHQMLAEDTQQQDSDENDW